MNAKELMIGDWVCLKTDEFGKLNCRVSEILACRLVVSDLKGHVWSNEDAEEWFDPIPLTPEILEKNGLDKVPELSMVINRDTMPMYHSPMLHYVHELQHALRLCGLNDMADNFKV